MKHDDWLERQIRELGEALAAVLGAGDRAREEADAHLEGLVGARLQVLLALPVDQVMRLVGHRFGEFVPERVLAAVVLLEAASGGADGAPLRARADALRERLVAAIGEPAVDALEAEIRDTRRT